MESTSSPCTAHTSGIWSEKWLVESSRSNILMPCTPNYNTVLFSSQNTPVSMVHMLKYAEIPRRASQTLKMANWEKGCSKRKLDAGWERDCWVKRWRPSPQHALTVHALDEVCVLWYVHRNGTLVFDWMDLWMVRRPALMHFVNERTALSKLKV